MDENIIKQHTINIPDDDPIQSFELDNKFEIPKDIDKFVSADDTVTINFETNGRFDTPAVLRFKDYTTRDISHLVMAKGENLIETIISILNNNVLDEPGFKAENMLIEEFYEVLIGLKAQFSPDAKNFEYRWLCENCQKGIDEEDKKLSRIFLDLTNLKYTSIEEAEENLRIELKNRLDSMTEEQFKYYCKVKYKSDIVKTREEVVKDFKLKEPLFIVHQGNIYELRFSRIGDLARAMKIAATKYNAKIRQIRARPGRQGIPAAQIHAEKEEEIAKLQDEKERDIILISQALCLVKKNGIELNYEQRIAEFGSIPKNAFSQYIEYRNLMRFGFNEERDCECNLCGHVDNRRSLHRDITFVDLLPFKSSEGSSATGIPKDVTSAIVFM